MVFLPATSIALALSLGLGAGVFVLDLSVGMTITRAWPVPQVQHCARIGGIFGCFNRPQTRP